MSPPTHTCPKCERLVPIYVDADDKGLRAYCAVCDESFVVEEEPFTKVRTPEEAAQFLVDHFALPQWMVNQLLYRCRSFGEDEPDYR